MEPWEGIVDIPEGKVGKYKIKHIYRPPGKVARSNMRTAYLGGQADEPLVFDRKTKWHQLSYEGGIWMTDLPIEQIQHDNELKPVTFGKVLVGGLGLGYAVNVLAAREGIDEITVVEISPEVCKLVGPHIKDPDDKVDLVNQDLFEFLKGTCDEWDWAFYDIWQSDGEGTFHNTVVPLRELSVDHVEGYRVICWNENVMRGQLVGTLRNRWMQIQLAKHHEELFEDPRAQRIMSAHLPEGGLTVEKLARPHPSGPSPYWDWAVPFWQGVESGVITEGRFLQAAQMYAGTYGYEGWKLWWQLLLEGKWKPEEGWREESEAIQWVM